MTAATQSIEKMNRVSQRRVRTLLNEFIHTTMNFGELPHDRLKAVVVQCCETSRDIRLLSGPPESVDQALRIEIGRAFWTATDVILSAADTIPQIDPDPERQESLINQKSEILEYVENIETRAELFLSKKPKLAA